MGTKPNWGRAFGAGLSTLGEILGENQRRQREEELRQEQIDREQAWRDLTQANWERQFGATQTLRDLTQANWRERFNRQGEQWQQGFDQSAEQFQKNYELQAGKPGRPPSDLAFILGLSPEEAETLAGRRQDIYGRGGDTDDDLMDEMRKLVAKETLGGFFGGRQIQSGSPYMPKFTQAPVTQGAADSAMTMIEQMFGMQPDQPPRSSILQGVTDQIEQSRIPGPEARITPEIEQWGQLEFHNWNQLSPEQKFLIAKQNRKL